MELRNRVIRLVGYGRLTLTTKALDEAADRISRYLLGQSLVNVGLGLAFGVGLYFIGLSYALLWGADVLLSAGADHVSASLRETHSYLAQLAALQPSATAPASAA